MSRYFPCLVLALLPFAAQAQFSLYRVDAGGETAAATAFDFGAVDPNVTATVAFRIRNTSPSTATLTTLSVSGVGFSLAGPATPRSLDSQAAVDFNVSFRGATNGLYSAGLNAPGISVLLVAEVQQGLTYSVSTPSGWQTLNAAGTVNFAATTLPAPITMQFLVQNPSALYLTVPALTVQGQGFALALASPSGQLLAPQQTAAFDIVFTPPAPGAFTGTLQAGSYAFPLSATALAPPLPKPSLAVSLPQIASAQQGRVAIDFDSASPVAASGTLTLTFQPPLAVPADPAIAFANGTLSMPFTLAAGSSQADFSGAASALFQTGTTAGTLTFTVALGTLTTQQTISIPPAPIAVTAAQVTRTASGLTVQLTALDNTRTAGKVSYTFFDPQGNAIAPAEAIDSTADFKSYFATSTTGGVFSLTAAFPVTGDASQIKACEVQLTNSAGTSSTQRLSF